MSFSKFFYVEQDLAREKNNNLHVEALMTYQLAFFLQLAIWKTPEKSSFQEMALPFLNVTLALGQYARELHQSLTYDEQKNKQKEEQEEEKKASSAQAVDAILPETEPASFRP